MTYVDIIAWNARVDNAHTHENLKRLAHGNITTKPHILGLTEVARRSDKELTIPGYRLYRHVPRRGIPGQVAEWRNSAVLVRRDVQVKRITWKRERRSWRGPKRGRMHDPRVWPELVVKVDGRTLKVAPALHFPFGVANVKMRESVMKWMRRTIPGRPVFACGDLNMRYSVWQALVRAAGFRPIHGWAVDHAASRNVVAGVHVERLTRGSSDHYAFRYRVWI